MIEQPAEQTQVSFDALALNNFRLQHFIGFGQCRTAFQDAPRHAIKLARQGSDLIVRGFHDGFL